jgi:hypothetical protein
MADLPARSTDLGQLADAFCEASIRDTTGRAVHMLAATPELAGYNFATSVILGDAGRVRAEIAGEWIETGIFLALALALAGFCFWRLGRRRT